jgi:hypothetical protein
VVYSRDCQKLVGLIYDMKNPIHVFLLLQLIIQDCLHLAMEFSFYHFVLERRLGTNREPILEQLQVFCIVILHGGGEPFVDILLINDNQFVRDPIVFCSINSTLWYVCSTLEW